MQAVARQVAARPAPASALPSVAQTRNQRAVATALDRGPVSNPLIIAVLNQTVAGARQAFDALSGEVFGSVHNAQSQEAQFARSAMLGRMRQSSYAGIPGDLGALGFGGPHWPTRRTMPVPLTQPRPRPAHEVPRAI